MLIKLEIYRERMEAKIEANNKKFEVFRGTLVSQMDIHLARTETIQENKANINNNQEKMETAIGSGQEQMRAAIISVRAEVEETMKHWRNMSWLPWITGPRVLRPR
jgi:hypothetical protein